MDYSVLASDGFGFGDNEPNPFSSDPPALVPSTTTTSSTLVGGDDDDDNTEHEHDHDQAHDHDPDPSSHYEPYIPPQTQYHPNEDDEANHGFESPTITPHPPHLDEDNLQSPGFTHEEFRSPGLNSPQQQEHFSDQVHRPEAVRPQHSSFRGQGQQQHPHRQVPQYRLQAKITALERTGRKDPILRFDVHTNLPKFRTTQFRDVRRTHPEFQKLASHLLSANPECFVPAVPPPSTSAGVGTDEDEARVRATMQRWLNTVCSNEVLMRDEEMVFFVESDFGYSPVVRRKQPATGVRRRVIKQFAPPPDDTPELEQARPVVKAFYLGAMETGQKVDRVVKSRRGLGLSESELGVRLSTLSQTENHPGMSNAWRKLGKTIQAVGDFHAAQATAEASTFGDPLNYHSSDAFIVKETLTNRQILMRELESARRDTRSKLQTTEVLKSKGSIRRDKVDEAIQSLDEARSNEQHLDSKVRRVTGNLLIERRRWFDRTSHDLRASIRDYTLRQIEAERRTLATLEAVRPDIRAIDSSGGLSRLGRDAPPASRRASIAASQGPRGDAWSGVQRVGGINRASEAVLGLNGGAAGAGVKTAIKEEPEAEGGEDDRLDAKNAASRLAGSTF